MYVLYLKNQTKVSFVPSSYEIAMFFFFLLRSGERGGGVAVVGERCEGMKNSCCSVLYICLYILVL